MTTPLYKLDTSTLPDMTSEERGRLLNSRRCRFWYERNRAYVLKMRTDRYQTDPAYRAMQHACASASRRRKIQGTPERQPGGKCGKLGA